MTDQEMIKELEALTAKLGDTRKQMITKAALFTLLGAMTAGGQTEDKFVDVIGRYSREETARMNTILRHLDN